MATRAIGTLGTIDTVTVGGRVFTDLANLTVLVAFNGATKNSTFRKMNATAGYQVPSGKTFTVKAVKVLPSATNTTGEGFYILYADNDVGMSTATAFTNPVTMGGVSSGSGTVSSTYSSTVVNELAVDFVVAALKYPAVTNANGTVLGTIYVYGIEA